MAEYAIFKRELTGSGGDRTLSFVTLQNPVDSKEPLKVEAGNDEDAMVKALELLRFLGVKLYHMVGEPELIMTEFPDYYLGKLNVGFADAYEDLSLVYFINQFIPIKEK